MARHFRGDCLHLCEDCTLGYIHCVYADLQTNRDIGSRACHRIKTNEQFTALRLHDVLRTEPFLINFWPGLAPPLGVNTGIFALSVIKQSTWSEELEKMC